MASDLSDDQLLRYGRHILLDEIGIDGQRKLLNSVALIVGLGGLGSPVAMYLAASGVGRLIIADGDKVELSNLQRQIVHNSDTLGMDKTESAKAALKKINPAVQVDLAGKLGKTDLNHYVKQADVVVDATDNFAARYAINETCRRLSTPLVSGAAIRMEGQVCVFTQIPGTPCYECLYPKGQTEVDELCATTGVLAPAVGIVGSIQATEALKILAGFGAVLANKLLLIDAKYAEWRTITLKQNDNCPVCAAGATV